MKKKYADDKLPKDAKSGATAYADVIRGDKISVW